MKVLLLAVPNTLADEKRRKGPDFGSRIVPLELLSSATVLKQGGHDVTVHDGLALNSSFAEIASVLKADSYERIVISGFDRCRWAIEPVYEILARFSAMPFALLGGYNRKLIEDVMDRFANVGFSTFGDPEFVLRDIADTVPFERITGVAYRKDGRLAMTGPACIQDLDELPVASREFVDAESYARFPHEDMVSNPIDVNASRGCPFSCVFCVVPLLCGRTLRVMSPERVKREIDELRGTRNTRFFHFQDPVFTQKKQWVADVCRLIEPMNIRWSCQTRIDLTDREILEKMRNAGCYSILYGIESLDEGVLEGIKKNIAVKKIEETVAYTRELGIETRLSYIVGLPGSTPEIIKADLEKITAMNPDFAQFHSIVAFPGTALYADFTKAGRCAMVSESKYDVSGYQFIPHGFKDYHEIKSLTGYCYKRFYLRGGFVLRAILNPAMWARYARGIPLLCHVLTEKIRK